MYDVATEKRMAQALARRSLREKKAAYVTDLKGTLRCALCPEREPACLDMHHLDPATKDFSVSDGLGNMSAARIQEELEKCVVLCSNCHRKVHAGILEVGEWHLVKSQLSRR